jgi:hypothetical protein
MARLLRVDNKTRFKLNSRCWHNSIAIPIDVFRADIL